MEDYQDTSEPTSESTSESIRSSSSEIESRDFQSAPMSASKKRGRVRKANGQRQALGDNRKAAAKARKQDNEEKKSKEEK